MGPAMVSSVYQPSAYLLLADESRLPVVGAISVDSEVERVFVRNAWKPDESWTATDSHGHEHRYVRDEEDVPRLPSLERRTVHVECDGSCGGICEGEGYYEDEWHCRQCDDVVEPGFVHDYAVEQGGIAVSVHSTYSVTVEVASHSDEPLAGASYAYVDAGGLEHRQPLPTLYPGVMTWESGFDRSVMRTEYSATEMRAVKHKPVGP